MHRLLIVILACLLLVVAPAHAQESTPNAPITVIPSDPTSNTPVIVVEAPEPPRDISDIMPSMFGLAAAVLVAVAGGGSILLIIDRLTKSKELKDNTERAFESLSPTWQATIQRALIIAEEANRNATKVLQFAKEATDGKPNTETPPTNTNGNSTTVL